MKKLKRRIMAFVLLSIFMFSSAAAMLPGGVAYANTEESLPQYLQELVDNGRITESEAWYVINNNVLPSHLQTIVDNGEMTEEEAWQIINNKKLPSYLQTLVDQGLLTENEAWQVINNKPVFVEVTEGDGEGADATDLTPPPAPSQPGSEVVFNVTNEKIQTNGKTLSDSRTKSVTKTVNVRVTKKDINTKELLEGATFGIYVDDVRLTGITTDNTGIATYTITHSDTLDTGTMTESYDENYDSLTVEEQANTQSKSQAEAKLAQRIAEKLAALETAFNEKTYEYKIIEEIAPTGYALAPTPSQTSNATSLEFLSEDPPLPDEPGIHKVANPASGTETDPAILSKGQKLTYTITVQNTNPVGGENYERVVVEDVIPDGLIIDEHSMKFQKNTNDIVLLKASGECTYNLDGNKLTIVIDKMFPQDVMYFTIPTKTDAVKTYENTAVIKSINGVDMELKSETTYHEVPEDPEIHKTSNPETGTASEPREVVLGSDIVYTIAVTNKNPAGKADFQKVLVDDPIPASLIVDFDNIKVQMNSDPEELLSAATWANLMSGTENNLRVLINELKAQDTVNILVPTKTTQVGVIENTARITNIDGVTKDIKSETTYHEVPELPDPEIHKESDPVTGTQTEPTIMQLGEKLTYTLTVINRDPAGNLPREKVVISDPIPNGLTIDYDNIQFARNSDEPVLLNTLSDVTLLYNGQELTFTIASLNAQDTAKFIIPTTTSVKGRYENTARITSINDVTVDIVSETTYHDVPDPNSISDTGDREVTKEVTVEVIKTDANDKNILLEGAVFDVFMDEQKIGTITTGKDGKGSYTHKLTEKLVSDTMTVNFEQISEKENAEKQVKALVVENLDAKQKAWEEMEHTYRIVETKAPAGYKAITFPDIKSAAKTVLFEVVNPKEGNPEQQVVSNSGIREVNDDTVIYIEKTDVETGAPLQGATFDIFENNKKLTTVTTDAQGKATFTIPHRITVSSGVYSEGYTDEKSKVTAEAAVEAKIKADLDAKEKAFKETTYNVSMVETTPPNGYMATTIPAANTDDNKITFIVKDRKQNVIQQLLGKVAPQTGDIDYRHIQLIAMFAGLVSAVIAGVLYAKLRKGQYTDDGGIE